MREWFGRCGCTCNPVKKCKFCVWKRRDFPFYSASSCLRLVFIWSLTMADDRRIVQNLTSDHMWTLLSDPSRSLTIAGVEQGSTPAIVGDCQRSSAIIWEHFSAIERSCAMATVCCCTCIQLFTQILNMAACSTEEFMKEYRKYKCRYSREYKDRYKKLNAWTKISEKFKITPDAVEAKLKNIRTASWKIRLKRRKNIPSGSERDSLQRASRVTNKPKLACCEHFEFSRPSVSTHGAQCTIGFWGRPTGGDLFSRYLQQLTKAPGYGAMMLYESPLPGGIGTQSTSPIVKSRQYDQQCIAMVTTELLLHLGTSLTNFYASADGTTWPFSFHSFHVPRLVRAALNTCFIAKWKYKTVSAKVNAWNKVHKAGVAKIHRVILLRQIQLLGTNPVGASVRGF